MGTTKYVVVYNKETGYTPVRHIITYHCYSGERDFWEWYYGEYTKIEGDKMEPFDTIGEAIAYSEKLNKEY